MHIFIEIRLITWSHGLSGVYFGFHLFFKLVHLGVIVDLLLQSCLVHKCLLVLRDRPVVSFGVLHINELLQSQLALASLLLYHVLNLAQDEVGSRCHVLLLLHLVDAGGDELESNFLAVFASVDGFIRGVLL